MWTYPQFSSQLITFTWRFFLLKDFFFIIEPIYESADDVINRIQENTNASRKYSSMSMDLSINSGSDSESKNQFYGENKNVYKLSDDENAILL